MGPLASKLIYCVCVKTTDVSQKQTTKRIEQQSAVLLIKECVTDDRQCRQAIIINCVLDAVKWRQETSLNSTLKTSLNSTLKTSLSDAKETPTSGATKVDKVDIKRTTKSCQKRTTIVLPNIVYFE